MSRQLKQLLLISVLLALAGLALVIAWQSGYLSPAAPVRSFSDPGAAAASLPKLVADEKIREDLQFSLLSRLGSPSGLRAWYQQADRETGVAAVQAEDLQAADQLYNAAWMIEQNQQRDFQDWWKSFQSTFVAADGLVWPSRSVQADGSLVAIDPSTAGSWPQSLQTLRVLGLAYGRWPSRSLDHAERQLSDRLLALWANGLTADSRTVIPTTAPSLDPAATPTPKPTGKLTPTPAASGRSESLLRLDSLDLLTMRSLASLDTRWQAIYEQSLSLVKAAYLGEDLPLYALGWLPEQEGYLMFAGDQPVVHTEAAVTVMLHLAEVGQAEPRSLTWLKERLFNDRALYESYHLAQGQATSTVECLPAYAMVARLARITGDEILYTKAVERLAWHLATSQTSSVRGLVFREDEAGLIRVYARDNLWALLAFE